MLRIEITTKSANVLASDQKHIVIVGPAHPLRGGLATYNQLLATRLQDQGHKVEILTFSLQYPSILFPGKSQYSSDPAPDDLNIRVALNSINPLNWWKEGRRLKKLKPDLVIFRFWMPFMGPCLGTLGRIVRKNKHTKVVAITDNIIPHEKRPLDTQFTSYFLKSCHGFVAMSRAVQADLKALIKTQPALFNPHPMYESFGAAVSKEEACKELGLDIEFEYMLFFGFIRKYKGLDLLLEAFAKVNNSKLKLIVAGEYYDSPEAYQELMDKLNLRDRIVEVNDFIPDSRVKYFFSASSLVVQTYKTATQSGVTQVAYYYDVPMLVTDVGGLAELVPHNKVGYVVPVDAQEIADSIETFYSEQKEAEFSKNILEEKKRFTWDSMINKLFEAAAIQ
ncbi:glycosyltransferase family 4 protein [bacterium]|nr:glycosyltransferase family 4 protein [bacterium]